MAASPQDGRSASGRYDRAVRRQSKRQGRERGCWVYIPAVELKKLGVDTATEPPFYRVWPGSRGGLLVSFYREP